MPEGAPLALADWRAQQVLHLDRPAVHFHAQGIGKEEELEQAAAWLNANPQGRLLVPAEHRDPCFDPDSGMRLGHAHRRDWVLLSRNDLSGTCTAAADPANWIELPPLRP
ncbi:MAG: hypothetical protein F4013_03055 [Gammaproteobacteria bacterium]|nr:hypothetical protein [Gammaproteobacteria bacterium]